MQEDNRNNEEKNIIETIKNLGKKIKTKKIILILIAVIILASCIITLTMQTIRQIQIKQIEGKPLIEYEIKNKIDKYTYEIIVKFNSAEGIETIKYQSPKTNEEVELNANGKITVGIDYIAKDQAEYKFKIKEKGKEETTETLKFEIPRIKGEYKFDDGIYVNKPDLTGYNQKYTRYLNISEEKKLEPGNWIDKGEPENWYNYKAREWANIYVEDNGLETYYVWIPRYCFKLNQGEERSEIKFIDVYDNYQDADGNITKWEQLEEEGYQIPEAFEFNFTQLPGYWAMKYTAGERDKYTISFDATASKTKIKVKTITKNTEEEIVKYTYAINGEKVHESETSDDFEKLMDTEGVNIVNVTALNANGEVVGSMTKEVVQAKVNEPELEAFNQETTYYVTYDEDGEHSTIPINQKQPNDWYDYGDSQWANIVTRNNGLETYYVWIPRYEFKLDQTAQRSNVNFIQGTKTEATEGYQIPEAFTFNEKELTGYWAMKYTAGTEAAPTFDTEVVATSSSIKTKGITGTEIKDGQEYVFNYYIDGEYEGTKTTSEDTFEFKELDSKKTYTILVEIRKKTDENNEDGEYLGTIVKQIKTIEPNKPELIGFNQKMTYYVTYNDQGEEIIGENIQAEGKNAPSNWYDYSKSEWANIVVTDGEVKDGEIKEETATMTTYYTWIPRYEFMITSSQQAQPKEGRTEVRFIEGKSTDTDVGYQIPEAFTFNGQQLTGYWAMKYTAGDK